MASEIPRRYRFAGGGTLWRWPALRAGQGRL